MEESMDKVLQKRIAALEDMTGLRVLGRRTKGTMVFSFEWCGGGTLKTVYTYRKAKMFAEGYRRGRDAGLAEAASIVMRT